MAEATLGIVIQDKGGAPRSTPPTVTPPTPSGPGAQPGAGTPANSSPLAGMGQQQLAVVQQSLAVAQQHVTLTQQLVALTQQVVTALGQQPAGQSGQPPAPAPPGKTPPAPPGKTPPPGSKWEEFKKGFMNAPGGSGIGTAVGSGAAAMLGKASGPVAAIDKILSVIGDNAEKYAQPRGAALGGSAAGVAATELGILAQEAYNAAQQIPILGGVAKIIKGTVDTFAASFNQAAKNIVHQANVQIDLAHGEIYEAELRSIRKKVEELEKIPFFGGYMAAKARRDELAPKEEADMQRKFLAERSQALTPYSPALMNANLDAQMRKMQTDLAEAQAVGPALARQVQAESRLRENMRRLQFGNTEREAGRRTREGEQLAALSELALSMNNVAERVKITNALQEKANGNSARANELLQKYQAQIVELIRKGQQPDEDLSAENVVGKMLEQLRGKPHARPHDPVLDDPKPPIEPVF